MERHKHTQYPLRIPRELRERVQEEAAMHRRSLNAELGLLIEEGLRQRESSDERAKV